MVATIKNVHVRLIHSSLVTSSFLPTCKIRESDLCSFCHQDKETIEHLFWTCPVVHAFWEELIACFWPYIDMSAVLNLRNVLLGITNTKQFELINLIILMVKRYIYVQRCKEAYLNLIGFINILKRSYNLEVEIYKDKSVMVKGRQDEKWRPLLGVLKQT